MLDNYATACKDRLAIREDLHAHRHSRRGRSHGRAVRRLPITRRPRRHLDRRLEAGPGGDQRRRPFDRGEGRLAAGDPRAGDRRYGVGRPRRPRDQLRQMLPHGRRGAGRRPDDRPRHRRAQPAERLGERAAHRRHRRRGQGAGRPHLSQRYAARARQGQASGIRHDPCRRAVGPTERTARQGGRGVRPGRHRDDAVAAHPRRGVEEAGAQRLHAADGGAAALLRP